jgi:phosphomannomutase
LLSILASGEKTLSKIYDELPKFVNTPEIRIDCPDDQKFVIVDKVHKRLRENGSFELNDIDGVRVSTEDGWWLLRASNTQPALVARCESRTAEGLSRLKGNLISLLSEFGVMLKSV